ncbi:MAG: hypothetical protein ACOYL8_02970 [Patescibacteria group bacterium]
MKKVVENVIDFLQESTRLLHDKLNPLGEGISLAVSTVEEKHKPDKSRHLEMDGLYARRFKSNEWTQRLDNIISYGFSGVDLMAALAPKNKGAEIDRYLLASIIFRSGTILSGEIELIREYNGSVLVSEFTMTHYRFNSQTGQKLLEEISADWESGVKLLCLSVLNYYRDPKQFIAERFQSA